ncbi:MAG: M23 family metallopeptidase [Candidatus Dormibacteria bacterium]
MQGSLVAAAAGPVGISSGYLGPGVSDTAVPDCVVAWPLERLVTPFSWVDHHYPTHTEDGQVVRYDGATNVNYDGHRGLDLPVPQDTPVLAAADGLVTYAGWDDAGGYGVGIQHPGCRTFYFHNSALLVAVGQRVRRGQVISKSGTTGNSTGPHVHFEIRDMERHWHALDAYGWTGAGPDPWPWDQGVLWDGGAPHGTVPVPPAPAPHAVAQPAPEWKLVAAPATPLSIVTGPLAGTELSADGTLRTAVTTHLGLEGPAVALADCGGRPCVLDRRGRLLRVEGSRPRLAFVLAFNQSGVAMDCWTQARACLVLDDGGNLQSAALSSTRADAPDDSALPAYWPLPGQPAGVTLSPSSSPALPAGVLVDSDGNSAAFGSPLVPLPPAPVGF